MLEGEVGFEVGDEVFTAAAGQLVAKPRGIWHAFWNAGDVPARVLEVISPAGFERYFAELQARYGLEMDFASIERLSREHGLGSP